MPGRPRSGVFLSYARKDGEDFAAKLRARLQREAPDIEVRQDRISLEGGVGWWKQITDAIDAVEFLVLVMTPAAMASGTVQKEWRYARQQGVCVYPVKGAPDTELRFQDLPRWMSKAHFFDLEKEWESFLAHLRKGCDARRVPFLAPDLPPNFVERPAEFSALKNLLLQCDRKEPVAITTALSGAGGFGKTTLAAALCHDEEIIESFDDGILWVTLGEKPDVISSLISVYAALTGERPGFATVEEAAFQLDQKLAERTCLLVIDDVWEMAHLRPFLRGAKSSARLFTTRNAKIASEATPVHVDEMQHGEAISMLTRGVSNLGGSEARELSQRLGEWPLALELAASMMRERIRQGESVSRAAERLGQIIESKGVRTLEDPDAERRHRTISSVLEVSLDLLDGTARRRLAELSIFPEDVGIPLAAAASVWELDELDAEDLAQRLARLSLLKLDLHRGILRLHDVMRSWLAAQVVNAGELHSRLVNGWTDWGRLPDLPGAYAWRWLPWHLAQAGRARDIAEILWNPRWMLAKLKATDVNALIGDYEYLKPSDEAQLLRGALRLSAHVLAADVGQFASQVVGRLVLHRNTILIGSFLDVIANSISQPWLRPLAPALHPAGTSLLRTMEGHTGWVRSVGVTADGRRAVSASRATLTQWELETGKVLCKLQGHTDMVSAVAVTADGQRAVSASQDKTLRVWDLETGSALRTLEGHKHVVTGVAVTADGRRAVSSSLDETLRVWDLESGSVLHALEGHTSEVNSVAVTADGRLAVSASADHTLKVWDLETGRVLHVLEGHTRGVNGVAVTADGRLAVSASSDDKLKVWDLGTGIALHTLEGHTSTVRGVAVTGDGRRAVSVSDDTTLKVWDLKTQSALRMLKGHTDGVSGVAATADGRLAVSASWDKTLKVWDLETGSALRSLEGHMDVVMGVAVTAGGRLAVSASYDKTLKVWDLETGSAVRTLEDNSRVRGVAVTGTGGRAVSAPLDKTLKVWDLETGKVVRSLEGHTDMVTGVEVTADGRLAVSGSWDKTLKVWDLETGSALRLLEGHSDWVNSMAVTGDGRLAVSASDDKTLKVWDLETGRPLQTLEGHTDSVFCVAVTADGRRAVSASRDNTLKVWDLETATVVAAFTCDAAALCCAFAGAQRIVAGDQAGLVHFLSLEPGVPAPTPPPPTSPV